MQYLLLGGKARAMLEGRFFVTTDDIKAVAYPVLRHRVITNFNAESAGITPDTRSSTACWPMSRNGATVTK